MPNQNTVVTLNLTGNKAAIDALVSAFASGAIAGGMWMGSQDVSQSGPIAVDAPALNTLGGNQVNVVLPNFTPEDGVNYRLEVSVNGWASCTTIADNLGPNDVVLYTYGATTVFRVVADSTPGPSTSPLP